MLVRMLAPGALAALATALITLPALAGAPFTVVFGDSWDGVSLQSILDAEYGVGVIDAATGYEGFLPGDADPGWWEDEGIEGIIIREVAGYDDTNTLGWYEETLAGPPVIDGIDDGVIFSGPMSEGQAMTVMFSGGITRFGLYLDPNGSGDATAAPQPELFFTNRFYNDIGPYGNGAVHEPTDGDPQCVIYNITHLRNGVHTFVVAWEDLDSGSEITPSYTGSTTDNDFQDLVIEITAISPVAVESSSWTRVKALFQD